MMLTRTFRDTRLAVGRLGWIRSYGRVRPTEEMRVSHGDRLSIQGRRTRDGDRDDNEQVDVQKLKRRRRFPSVDQQAMPVLAHLEVAKRRSERI